MGATHFPFHFPDVLGHPVGMPSRGSGVVDAHVHLYPAFVAADPAAFAAQRDESLWATLVMPRPGGGRALQGWADDERLLRDMDAAGVERAILLGWYWEHHETCIWHNRYHAGCVRAHPDRLSWFATVQARAGQGALDEMKHAADAGAIGLGEICPRAFGVSPLDATWLPVFARAVDLGWPVNLHVTDPASRRFPGRVVTPLEEIISLATQLPELRLVLAHFGGGLALHELNAHARVALRRALYDSAATPLLYDPRVYAVAASIVGADRILLGSDYPLLVHPKEQTEPDLRCVIADVRASGLDGDALALVLGGNARRALLKHERGG